MPAKNTISDCRSIKFSKDHNQFKLGTIVNNNIDIPFAVKRVYYIYNVPNGKTRGGHGHRELEKIIISVKGSFVVHLYDGLKEKRINLNKPNMGLYVLPGIWHQILNFSPGAVCLVLASDKYNPDDYIRDHNELPSLRLND
jgi:dTDP-4-dehydrorhamnose 3,5-epimerase-like enzyme